MDGLTIVVAGIVSLLSLVVGYLLRKYFGEAKIASAEQEANKILEDATRQAESIKKEARVEVKDDLHKLRTETENELKERRQEVLQLEKRLVQKEETLDQKEAAVSQREQSVSDKEEHYRAVLDEAEEAKAKQERVLEELSGLSRSEAREVLRRHAEEETRHDMAKMVRAVEGEAKREGERRARTVLSLSPQRTAPRHVAATTVSVVQLPSDDMKGRIIGREGRNIRTLEKATGCDLIVDDTPESIVVSSFDPIRREVARQAILKLLADGRIHPARIEEVVEKVKVDMDQHLKEIGEAACIELGFPDVHPKLQKLVGRLNYRTSYGQNVLEHTKEVARIAEYMAGEMGSDARLARRAGLFHDIGKAIDREVEGTHIEIGMQLMQRYGEKEDVIHAMSCHHGDFEPRTVEAMLITAADALSAARPGCLLYTSDAA